MIAARRTVLKLFVTETSYSCFSEWKMFQSVAVVHLYFVWFKRKMMYTDEVLFAYSWQKEYNSSGYAGVRHSAETFGEMKSKYDRASSISDELSCLVAFIQVLWSRGLLPHEVDNFSIVNLVYIYSILIRPRGYKLFSCSAQFSMIFFSAHKC